MHIRSLTATAFFAILSWRGAAQTRPQFDVASIHLNHGGDDGTTINTLPGGRFSATNATLRALILTAFGIHEFQVAGGPSWLDSTPWNVEAKTGGAEEPNPEQLRPLLQSLLADRFQLRFHRETREGPVYSLIVTKTGSKLTPHTGAGRPSGGTYRNQRTATMSVTKVTMANLANALTGVLDRPVINNTGLAGDFDFKLEWTPDQSADSTGPSIFTAVQEQLGLKLETARGPIETIVIDSAEKAET